MLTFGAILGAFYFMAGMRKLLLVAATLAVLAALVAAFPHLEHYQQQRLISFLAPGRADPRYRYQTEQSLIAVGSGGVLGKGITQGTQGRLGFLPFAHSDFIGAVVAEETGSVGVVIMIALYLVLLMRLLAIARTARDKAGGMMIIGFTVLLVFHITCNLGMVVGLMPVMGIPLPLMSQGGTALLATFAGVGLALSVRSRRFVN